MTGAGRKQKGARRERQSRDMLRRAGFEVVKAGGSLGMFDLIGIRPEDATVILVQVKSNRGVGPQEREQLADFAYRCASSKWQVAVHRWRDRKGVQVETI